MKWLKTFDELTEKIHNKKLVQHEVDKMLDEIKKYIPLKEYDNFNYGQYTTKDIEFNFSLNKKQVKFIKIIDKIIAKYKNVVFPRINVIMKSVKLGRMDSGNMSYDNFDEVADKEIYGIKYEFYLKNINLERSNPDRFLYHCSKKENRKSIEKHGLIPKSDMESNIWKYQVDVAYPPAIFASNNKYRLWGGGSGDIWIIDTKGLSNKWWFDLYFNKGDNNYIVTFEPIPPDHIKRNESVDL